MKYIIAILSIFLCSSAFAQSGQMAQSKDTTVNADTVRLFPTITIATHWLSFQVNVTKVSGTVAGNAIVQCSEDALNWFTATGTDTLTLTNANNYKRWELGIPKSRFYRVRVITSGTQSSAIKGFYYAK
ncbi:hypothetical protein ACE38W_14545 [Chitinophaga sp. Hz27]|uniref:hypothetical protein n=1 Tax=Chitinophaga sp. Hz27 TaxID=3347169 RepID=UPI0035D5AFCD